MNFEFVGKGGTKECPTDKSWRSYLYRGLIPPGDSRSQTAILERRIKYGMQSIVRNFYSVHSKGKFDTFLGERGPSAWGNNGNRSVSCNKCFGRIYFCFGIGERCRDEDKTHGKKRKMGKPRRKNQHQNPHNNNSANNSNSNRFRGNDYDEEDDFLSFINSGGSPCPRNKQSPSQKPG